MEIECTVFEPVQPHNKLLSVQQIKITQIEHLMGPMVSSLGTALLVLLRLTCWNQGAGPSRLRLRPSFRRIGSWWGSDPSCCRPESPLVAPWAV